ncbi:MAG: hypothetical protein ACP5L2_07495 [Conexivisphaera sp.]
MRFRARTPSLLAFTLSENTLVLLLSVLKDLSILLLIPNVSWQ